MNKRIRKKKFKENADQLIDIMHDAMKSEYKRIPHMIEETIKFLSVKV